MSVILWSISAAIITAVTVLFFILIDNKKVSVDTLVDIILIGYAAAIPIATLGFIYL